MASALGGEDKAYFFWMRNKGNHLKKAPNGADSKLFSTLLDYFEGNRTQAIRAKAKVYTNEFFNWFGKWTEDNKENVSKVVDENGEPLIESAVKNNGEFSTTDDNIYNNRGENASTFEEESLRYYKWLVVAKNRLSQAPFAEQGIIKD